MAAVPADPKAPARGADHGGYRVTMEQILKRKATRLGLQGEAWRRYVYGTLHRWSEAQRRARPTPR